MEAGKLKKIKCLPTEYRNVQKYTNNDWTIVAYSIPRDCIDRKNGLMEALEITDNSIYFLVGDDWDAGLLKVYVGRAAINENAISAIRRLKQHTGNKNESYWDIWDTAIAFKFNGMSEKVMRNIENYFFKNIKPEMKLNTATPDSSPYIYDDISDKVNMVKQYMNYICGCNICIDEVKEKELAGKAIQMKFTEEEKRKEGKRLVAKHKETVTEVVTPSEVVEDMLDLLPDSIWNPNTRFLDIACKGGEFLKAIFNRLIKSPLYTEPIYDDIMTRATHIIVNQLYGIAFTDESMEVTDKNFGLLKNIKKLDIKSFSVQKGVTGSDKLKKECLDENHKKLAHQIREAFSLEDTEMFDVVIGNPPYQDASGKASIYNRFAEQATYISKYTCLLTRDNWMNGKAFKSMRDKLIEKGSILKIVHYPVLGEVFESVSVPVTYYLWCNETGQKTQYICIKNGENVMNQDLDISDGTIYKSYISKDILTKLCNRGEWPSIFNTRSYPFMDQRKRERITEYTLYKEDDEHNIAVMANDEPLCYVSDSNFANISEVRRFKVLCGVIINEASIEKPGKVLTNIKAIGPNVVSSETWSLIATFNTQEETVNCKKYIQTKFVRFIANQTVNGRSNVTDNTFEYVPVQDFTSESDIDWSQSVADIDQQLYKKYNLTDKEISYIEKTIKPMDTVSNSQMQLKKEDVHANYINSLIKDF